MELDDKLNREAMLLKNLVEADEEEKKEVKNNNNYFDREKTNTKETAWEDMKADSSVDVSTMILKKARKKLLTGLLPEF